jgi:hypothetical protein
VSQVVHDYGDVCQAITELAGEMDAPISTEDFRTLNRCLDDAIAGAVTEYGREQNESGIEGESVRGSERLGRKSKSARRRCAASPRSSCASFPISPAGRPVRGWPSSVLAEASGDWSWSRDVRAAGGAG